MAIRIQLRRDTAANWVSSNPVLRQGEIGIETDTLKMKLGNGSSTWTQITAYMNIVPDGNLDIGDYIPISAIGAVDGVVGLDNSKNALIPGSSIIVEGSTDNSFETTLTVTNPTADRTITFKNADGTVAFTSDIPSTTDTLTEGSTNKYFTDERAQDAVATALAAGTHTNVTVSYNDASNSLSLASAPGYVDEQAVDAVAAALAAGTHTNISVAYNDAGNSISLTGAVTYTDENAQDAIGNALGTGLSYNDTTGAISVDTTAIQARVTNVTDTEIGYLDGVTSAIQTQIDTKLASSTAATTYAPLASPTFTGTLTIPSSIVVEGATADDYETTLTFADPTADRTITFPNNSGTVAFTSDISAATGGSVSETGTQTITNKSMSFGSNTFTGTLAQFNTALTDANFAPIDSPTFTGTPALPTGTTAITQTAGNSSTAVATTAFVGTAVANLVDSSPALLNTLDEIAAAIGDDPNFAATLSTSIGLKAPIASPTFTGTVAGITSTMVGLGNVDNTSDVNKPVSTATQTALDLKLDLTSPAVDYYITNSGSGAYLVNGVSNGNIYFEKGKKYRIHVNASGHPFWIQTVSGAYSSGDVYSTGITNNGTQSGHIIVELPSNAPQLYYVCQYHSSMAGSVITGTTFATYKALSDLSNVTNTSDANKPVSTATQTALDLKAPLASPTFTGTVAGITKTMVGLGSVDNTTDAAKPISTATQTALDLKLASATAATTYETITNVALKAPIASPTFTGTVAGITSTMVGLGNVDNTSDANKPVSTATQTALDLKVDESLFDAKGDLLVASADNTPAKLTVGTNGYLLTANSAATNGVEWAAAPVSLPSQTGNSGYYLTTNGTVASWGALVVPITTGTATVSANTATTVDTTALSAFTSIEYMVSLKQGSKVRTSKVVVQTDGTSVDMTEFAITETGGTITGVVVSATTASTNAVLQLTVTDAATTNVTVKFSKVAL